MISKCTVSPRTSPKRHSRLTRAHGADGFTMALGAAQFYDGAKTFDRTRCEIERGLVLCDQFAAFVVVGVLQRRRDAASCSRPSSPANGKSCRLLQRQEPATTPFAPARFAPRGRRRRFRLPSKCGRRFPKASCW